MLVRAAARINARWRPGLLASVGLTGGTARSAARYCSTAAAGGTSSADNTQTTRSSPADGVSPSSAKPDEPPTTPEPQSRGQRETTLNSVTLVGVAHDIQSGYVFEDAVTQFTLTTTSLDTTNPTQECVVEKDHHTVRCFGDVFSEDVKRRVKEGNVVCVNGRLRLNPQLEPSCNKYYYFPFVQVQPPHGQVAVVYGDRRAAPAPVDVKKEDIPAPSETQEKK